MNAQLSANPFTQRGAIHDCAQFFGRQAPLARIFEQITRMQSVSVVGERRIGKSSLLYYIAQKGQPYLPKDAQIVYLDVQRVTDEADFYARLVEILGGQGDTFRDLERALRGKQFVVCLDEFEHVAGNTDFSVDFFNGLRSLAQDGLALVTATQRTLPDLCRDKQFSGSQFWNIFRDEWLGLFTEEEAREFVRTRFTQAGVVLTEEECAYALRIAGRYPFFLQMACYHLYEARTAPGSAWDAQFKETVKEHLHTLWESRTPREQTALRRALDGRNRPEDDLILRTLAQRGLLVPDGPEFRVFSEAFAEVVRSLPITKAPRVWRIGSFKVELTPTPPWIKLILETSGAAKAVV